MLRPRRACPKPELIEALELMGILVSGAALNKAQTCAKSVALYQLQSRSEHWAHCGAKDSQLHKY